MTSVHPPSCPVVVVGGYLGAGKTTLVNHMLRHAAGRRVAVLVNDFGTVSIDASLIEGQGDDGVLAIAGGCMCCAYGEDLVGTLSTVAARQPAPQAILVECSGVGLPGAVARAAALVPAIRVEGVVVLVDAAEIVRLIDDVYVGDTVRQQLREADLLIVNQSDRVVEEAWPAVDQVLSHHLKFSGAGSGFGEGVVQALHRPRSSLADAGTCRTRSQRLMRAFVTSRPVSNDQSILHCGSRIFRLAIPVSCGPRDGSRAATEGSGWSRSWGSGTPSSLTPRTDLGPLGLWSASAPSESSVDPWIRSSAPV